MQERRKSKRLDLAGKLIIKPLGEADSAESVTIDVADCSRHGLGFVTEKHLVMGDNYEAYLTIWTKEVLHVFLQIVRGEKKENENMFSYGSVFIGMPDAERQRIAAEKEAEKQRIAAEKEAAKKQAEMSKLVSRFTGNIVGALGRQAGSAITRGLFGTKR